MECFAKQKYNIKDFDSLKTLNIKKPDEVFYQMGKKRFDETAKPIDGLGEFEDAVSRICSIQRKDDITINKKALLIMCSDNGIVEEGVSQSTSEVTFKVAKNMLREKSSAALMAKNNNIDCFVVDIGIDSDEEPDGIINRKVRKGSRNFLKESAMTKEETLDAICVGIDMVMKLFEEGYNIIAVGEMGIGNTTTSSAICASLLGCDAEAVTGRGAGLDDEKLKKKINVIKEAVNKYDLTHCDVFEVLSTVGGYDIASLAGICIGGALLGIPIVLDGIITQTAAYVALRINGNVKDYLFASHIGKEPASRLLLSAIGLKGVIDANMALGEGCGAIMYLSLLEDALCVYKNASKFDELEMEEYERFDK